jgi:hypothetical protein
MAINVLTDTDILWEYDPIVSKPKKAKKVLQTKYEDKYHNKLARQGKNYKYTPNLKPAQKKGLTIKNGLDPSDTVVIAIAISYKGKWHTWKLGFSPEVSNPYIRFHFNNGEKRKLRYKSVWQYLQDNYIGKETPDEDLYLDCLTRNFKVPFPALEAFDNQQSGVKA